MFRNDGALGVRWDALSMGRLAASLVAALMVAVAAHAAEPSPQVARELAPTGTLRAAINYGNPVLAQKTASGEPGGVSVELARELGKRLGVPVELVFFDAAGKVFEAVKAGAWDIAVPGDRSRARGRDHVHPALRGDRGHVHGRPGTRP